MKRSSIFLQYVSMALLMVCAGVSSLDDHGRQRGQQTFDRLVKKRASWYSSDQSRSCKKLIGLLNESNKSTIEEL